MFNPAYMVTDNNITIFYNDNIYTYHKSSGTDRYQRIVEYIAGGEWQSAVDAMSPATGIKSMVEMGSDRLGYNNGTVTWDGRPIDQSLSKRVLKMWDEGFDITPMENFIVNLMENPSKRSVDNLYRFLEHNDLPITSDGYFLAYKYVTEDYKDCHTRTFDNSVGAVCSVPRNTVDEDPNRTCSSGLHFASIEYVRGGNYGNGSGRRLMVVKVNPRDVVAVPHDYNNAKVRCCQYEVVSELEDGLKDYLGEGDSVRHDYSSDYYDADEYDYYDNNYPEDYYGDSEESSRGEKDLW